MKEFPLIYPIVFVADEGEADAALGLALTLLDAGAKILQLRTKDVPDAVTVAMARTLAARCRDASCRFIINDRPDIARVSGADGVHLGTDDLPITDARTILGVTAWVGCSTDTAQEAAEAARAGADYVAWGSVFPTATKADAAAQAGPRALTRVRAALPDHVPLVAIGGIELSNIAQVAASGADSAAVISALRTATDPGATLAALETAFRDSARTSS